MSPADGQTNGALVKAPISAGGSIAAFVPQTFDEAWRIAGALATSGITPFKQQEQVLAVMMAGAEVGLTPFAATQTFALINGRATMWGDGMLAVARARGHRVEEWTTGSIETGDFTAYCKVTRADNGEVVQRDFSMADAKTAKLWGKRGRDGQDTPWITYPKRMICMRARSWALRDGCADTLRGIKMAEEMQDVEVVDSVVIDRTGDHDQRPAEERDPRINPKYGVIGGQAGKDVFDDLAQRMSEATAEDELDAVWEEAAKTPLSKNRMDALAEYCEAVRVALREEAPIPPAPRFSEEPEPSPFQALKVEGEAVTSAEAFNTFNANMKRDLSRCTPQEREALKPIHAAAKQRAAQTKSGAGAATRTDGDASSPTNDAPGGAAEPASSSPFESLKETGLAVLQEQGPRRKRAAYAEWLEALCIGKPKCSPMEQRELETIEANVGKEIGA